MGWSLRIKKSISKDSQKNLIFRKGEGGSREKTICRGGAWTAGRFERRLGDG